MVPSEGGIFVFQFLSGGTKNISSFLWMLFAIACPGVGVHIPLHSLSDLFFSRMGTNKKMCYEASVAVHSDS